MLPVDLPQSLKKTLRNLGKAALQGPENGGEIYHPA